MDQITVVHSIPVLSLSGMGDITELAIAMIGRAGRRAELAGHNLANSATPSFKRHAAFTQLLHAGDLLAPSRASLSEHRDQQAGKMVHTGNATDLTVEGAGALALRGGEETLLARSVSLTRSSEGRLLDQSGRALQTIDGGDVVLQPGEWSIDRSGTVVQSEQAVARIGIFAPAPDQSALDRAAQAREPLDRDASTPIMNDLAPAAGTIRQGAFEASNVSASREMIVIMEAIKHAETGQRVLQVHDGLMQRILEAAGTGK
jgi:flagellar basal-body rod protein FlgF